MSGRRVDLKGKRFGKLIAIEPIYINDETVLNKRKWKCLCDCGNEVLTDTFQLTGGSKNSCGCLYRMPDLLGVEYQFAKVISFAYKNNKNRPYWNCMCHCGNAFIKSYRSIIRGTANCGCQTKLNYSKSKKRDCEHLKHSAIKSVIDMYKRNCSKRNHEFLISDNEVIKLFNSNCYYCGTHPCKLVKMRLGCESFYLNGIDRLNSKLGYIPGNVVPCCTACNYFKGSYSKEEFLNIIKKIATNLKLVN